MRHPKAESWERTLRQVFDRIDAELEAKYGDRYPLHPARARHGTTANPGHSGLFTVDASFSPGYGSRLGAGYIIDVDMVTLTDVPDEVEEQILEEVVTRIRQDLPEVFPGRILQISRDGHMFKIHGDLSLGRV